jgi:hypothetical protein
MENGSDRHERIIEEDLVDLGMPIRRIRAWSMFVTSLEEKPEIIQTTSWYWLDDGVSFSINAKSRNEELYRNFIRKVISFRRK